MKRLTMLFFVLTLLLPIGNLSSHAQSRDQDIQELKRMIEEYHVMVEDVTGSID